MTSLSRQSQSALSLRCRSLRLKYPNCKHNCCIVLGCTLGIAVESDSKASKVPEGADNLELAARGLRMAWAVLHKKIPGRFLQACCRCSMGPSIGNRC